MASTPTLNGSSGSLSHGHTTPDYRTFDDLDSSHGQSRAPRRQNMTLCGKELRLASDDFSVNGFFMLTVDCVWLVLSSIVLAASLAKTPCQVPSLVQAFLYGFEATVACSIACQLLLIGCSFRGTLYDEHGRRPAVSALLAIHFTLYLVQIAFVIVGSVVIFDTLETVTYTPTSPGCLSEEDVNMIRGAVFVGYAVTVVRMLRLLYVFRVGICSTCVDDASWTGCLKVVCCLARKDSTASNTIWESLSESFATVFGGHAILSSDLSTGLLLIRQHHHHLLEKLRKRELPFAGSGLEVAFYGSGPARGFRGEEDLSVLEELNRYCPYALGAYGWPLTLAIYPWTGCCRVASNMSCCHRVQHDACGCCQAGFAATARIPSSNIAYGNMQNQAGLHLPFFVVPDHDHKTLVLSVRGTLTVSDLVTDGMAVCERVMLVIDGTPVETDVHAGIWGAAKQLFSMLVTDGLLERIFRESPETRGYRILAVGQSLGAATSTLLTVLLRNTGYDAQCYAYQTAPVMSAEAARLCERFVTSVVIGTDFIASLSTQNLLRAKAEMTMALQAANASKGSIFWRDCLCDQPTPWWENTIANERYDPHNQPPGMKYRPLVIAGKVVHLVEEYDWQGACSPKSICLCYSNTCYCTTMTNLVERRDATKCAWDACVRPTYVPLWSSADNFDRVWMTGRPTLDHCPTHLRTVLKNTTEDYRIRVQAARTSNGRATELDARGPASGFYKMATGTLGVESTV